VGQHRCGGLARLTCCRFRAAIPSPTDRSILTWPLHLTPRRLSPCRANALSSACPMCG
jgi:hypothetical protein